MSFKYLKVPLPLLISCVLFVNAEALEIKSGTFVGRRTYRMLETHGYNYGVLLSLESDEEILDSDGKEIYPIEFYVSKKNNPENFVQTKNFNKFTSSDENPKKVDYFLLGSFAPDTEYIISARRINEYDSIELKASPDLEKELSPKEKFSAWTDNKFDFDFSFRPITNLTNTFAGDVNLSFESLWLLYFRFPKLELEGTVVTTETAKNGFKLSLNVIDFSSVFPISLGKEFGDNFYLYRFSAGGFLESDQKWNLKRYYLKLTGVVEVPYTNLPSMKVHRQYQILRSAPGIMISGSILQSFQNPTKKDFAEKSRFDLGVDYNLTLNPIFFLKTRNQWFYCFDTKKFKYYQDYTLGVRFFQTGNSFYFVKLIKGYNPPNFLREFNETSLGITMSF